MSSVPLQRTKAKLEEAKFSVWIVEKWVSFPPPGHRVDMFNLIDAVAVREDIRGVLGVQACASSGRSAHRKKALANPYIRGWLLSGNAFEIWSWSKRGEAGKRKLWSPIIDTFVISAGQQILVEEKPA